MAAKRKLEFEDYSKVNDEIGLADNHGDQSISGEVPHKRRYLRIYGPGKTHPPLPNGKRAFVAKTHKFLGCINNQVLLAICHALSCKPMYSFSTTIMLV